MTIFTPSRLVCIGLGAFAIVLVFFLTRSSEQEKIRLVLETACELAAVQGADHPVQRLEKARRLADLLADSVSIRAELFGEEHELDNKEEFVQKIAARRTALSQLELTLRDYKYDINETGASVEITFNALGAMPGAQGQFYERHRVRIGMVRRGGWKIASVEHLENLRAAE